jgi:hypothetical protein
MPLVGSNDEGLGQATDNFGLGPFSLRIQVAADAYLSSDEDLKRMTALKRKFVTDPTNIMTYGDRSAVSAPVGNTRAGTPFRLLAGHDSDRADSLPISWPTKLILTMVNTTSQWGTKEENDDEDVEYRLVKLTVVYNSATPQKVILGKTPDPEAESLVVNLDLSKTLTAILAGCSSRRRWARQMLCQQQATQMGPLSLLPRDKENHGMLA